MAHIGQLTFSRKAAGHNAQRIISNASHGQLHIGIGHNVLLLGGSCQLFAHAFCHALNLFPFFCQLLAVFVVICIQPLHALLYLLAYLLLQLLAHALLFAAHFSCHKAVNDLVADLFRSFLLHTGIALHLLRPQLIHKICDLAQHIAVVSICCKFSGA